MARGDPSNQGGAFNPKEGWQPNDRPYMMNIPAGGRFPPQPQNQPQSPHPRPQVRYDIKFYKYPADIN
jgi:hypothetical protein